MLNPCCQFELKICSFLTNILRFPLFHSPSLIRRIQNREYLTDRSSFADTMAVCALASARARDGALFPGRWDPEHFKNPTPESFFAAAKEIIPQDLGAMRGLDWMRTCALLALYGIQVGRIEVMHQYLGLYQSLVAMDNLHDEKNWPKSGIVEVELRRRLVSPTSKFQNPTSLMPAVLVNVYPRSTFLHSLGQHNSLSRISMQCALPKRSR